MVISIMKNNKARKGDRKAQYLESSFDIRVKKGLPDKMLRADTRMEGMCQEGRYQGEEREYSRTRE